MGEIYVPPGARDYRSEGMVPMASDGPSSSNPFQVFLYLRHKCNNYFRRIHSQSGSCIEIPCVVGYVPF